MPGAVLSLVLWWLLTSGSIQEIYTRQAFYYLYYSLVTSLPPSPSFLRLNFHVASFLFTVLDAKDPGSNPGGCKLSVCPVRDCGTESAKAVIIFDSAVIVFYDGRYSRGLSR